MSVATSRAKPKHAPLDAEALEREVSRVRAQLHSDGALRLASIKPKALREQLVQRLVDEGFEANKTWLRRPLGEQLRGVVAHGATLPGKSLRELVRGASAAELQQALKSAVARGEAVRVLRGKTEAFTGPETPVLGARQVAELQRALSKLAQSVAKAAKSKGVALLVCDIEDSLAELRGALAGPIKAAPPDGARESSVSSSEQHLLAALDAARDQRTGLSFVPKVVSRLLSQMPLAVAHDVLLTAARRELIELRPEGGLGRLTEDELSLCPPGPSGTRLSWARRAEGEGP